MILLIFTSSRRQPRYFTNRLVNAYFPAFRAVLVSSGSFLVSFFSLLLQSFTSWKSTIVISSRNTTSRKRFLIIGIMVAHLFKFQSMNDYSSVNGGFFSGTGRSSFLLSTLRKVYRGKFWNGYVEKFGESGKSWFLKKLWMSGGKKMMEVYERSVSIFHTRRLREYWKEGSSYWILRRGV